MRKQSRPISVVRKNGDLQNGFGKLFFSGGLGKNKQLFLVAKKRKKNSSDTNVFITMFSLQILFPILLALTFDQQKTLPFISLGEKYKLLGLSGL